MSVDYTKANPYIVEETKDLVFGQFSESKNIQLLVELIAEEAKSYEEVAEKVFTSFLLSEATGFALDSIGEFINFPREGRSDDAYRTALVIAAIGSGSSITRDSIANLIDIVTGGIGGYFVQGRYHDLYIYLQDACVERSVAQEFIDKYLPTNTQASVLFESGTSFGFEGNDLAGGFDKVRQQAGEGEAFLQFPVAEAVTFPEMILPRAFEFTADNTYDYRTVEEVNLKESVVGAVWDIPNTYEVGDVLAASIRNNFTNETFVNSYQIQSTPDADLEVAEFASELILGAKATSPENVYIDDTSGYKLYLGYQEITGGSQFSGRDSTATEFLSGNLMTTAAVDQLRDKRDPNTGNVVGILYEAPTKNLVDYGNTIETGSAYWSLTGTVDTTNVVSSIHILYDAYNYEFTSDIEFSATVVAPEDGYYAFSVFFRTSLDSAINNFVGVDSQFYEFNDQNPFLDTIVDDFLESRTQYYGLWVRVEVSDYFTAGNHTVKIGSKGSGTATYFGAMFEKSRLATSYVPTTGTPATRARDFFNLTQEPSLVGFNDKHSVQVQAKDYDGFSAWSFVELSGLTKGDIEVPEGESFLPKDSVPYTIEQTIAADDWFDGFGPNGVVFYDDAYTNAGDFCTRVSLTSRDILGYLTGPDDSAEQFEYELDSKFSKTLGFTFDSATLASRPLQVIEDFTSFRGPEWDVSLASIPTSYGLALRSPDALPMYQNFATKEIKDSPRDYLETLIEDPSVFEQDNNNVDAFDIELPNKPYYFEVALDDVPNAPAVDTLLFSQSYTKVDRNLADDGSGTIKCSILSLYVSAFYNSGTSDYTIEVKLSESVLDRAIASDGTETDSLFYTIESIPYYETAADLTSLSETTFGVLIDPIVKNYRVYVDGVAYNDPSAGFAQVTSVDGPVQPSGDSEVIVGDVYSPIKSDMGKCSFGVAGYTDNSEAEPTTLEDYGRITWVYSKDDLRFTSQLPQNTVDIFGRIIPQA